MAAHTDMKNMKNNLHQKLQLAFDCSWVESMLPYCLGVWYAKASTENRRGNQKISGCPLPRPSPAPSVSGNLGHSQVTPILPADPPIWAMVGVTLITQATLTHRLYSDQVLLHYFQTLWNLSSNVCLFYWMPFSCFAHICIYIPVCV